MRVAVTGAAGFVGRSLCPMLRARGHVVVEGGREVTGDIAARHDWPRALGAFDAVVHLAALAHARGQDPARLRAVNVDAAEALGRHAAAAGARMIFLSSIKARGEDSADAPFDESSPLAPADAYGRAKADAERALAAVPGLRWTTLVPPLVYGPGVRANFLALMRAIDLGLPLPLASVRNRRSLIAVENLCDAIRHCLEAPLTERRACMVADGPAVSTPELCAEIGAALGRPARLFRFPVRLLDPVAALRPLVRSLELDDRLMRRSLGWRPPLTFRDGIRGAVEAYRGNRDRDR